MAPGGIEVNGDEMRKLLFSHEITTIEEIGTMGQRSSSHTMDQEPQEYN
jgi:hypothetical protein